MSHLIDAKGKKHQQCEALSFCAAYVAPTECYWLLHMPQKLIKLQQFTSVCTWKEKTALITIKHKSVVKLLHMEIKPYKSIEMLLSNTVSGSVSFTVKAKKCCSWKALLIKAPVHTCVCVSGNSFFSASWPFSHTSVRTKIFVKLL